jgi:hypothetical protein
MRSEAEIDAKAATILHGAIDLHCHSGPSMIPRKLDHLEAARNGASIGLRAIVVKDHHLTCLREIYFFDKYMLDGTGVQLFGGVPLNNSVGGLNPYAVDLGRKMGAKIVWMPTVSAKEIFGVVIEPETLKLDINQTEVKRQTIKTKRRQSGKVWKEENN